MTKKKSKAFSRVTEQEIVFLRESNAIEGVYDHDSLVQASKAWEYLIDQEELTIDVVLKSHEILMLNQPLQPNERGHFRKCGVWVRAHSGPSWKNVPALMFEWCVKNKGEKTEEEIKALHVEFEEIHGFVDGNGRLGRLLLLWQTVKNGLPVRIIYEKERDKYYRWFIEK